MKKIILIIMAMTVFQPAFSALTKPENSNADTRADVAAAKEAARVAAQEAALQAEKKRIADKNERTANAQRELEINAINKLRENVLQINSQVKNDIVQGRTNGILDEMKTSRGLSVQLVYLQTGDMDLSAIENYKKILVQKISDASYSLYSQQVNDVQDEQIKKLKN